MAGDGHIEMVAMISLSLLAVGVLIVLARTIADKFGAANEVVAGVMLADNTAGATVAGGALGHAPAQPVASIAAATGAAATPTAAPTRDVPDAPGATAQPAAIYTWGDYFRDIPRGAYNALAGDQSCETLGCKAARDLMGSVPYAVGDAVETRDAIATFEGWRRGEATMGEVVNQAIIAALPGATGVFFRYYVEAVQASAGAMASGVRRLLRQSPSAVADGAQAADIAPVVQQRVEELSEAASNAAGGLERYGELAGELESSWADWWLGRSPRAVPSAPEDDQRPRDPERRSPDPPGQTR
jgi:hypothetical protein